MRVGISEYHIKYCWPGKDPQLLRVHMSGKESSERLKRKTPAKASFWTLCFVASADAVGTFSCGFFGLFCFV